MKEVTLEELLEIDKERKRKQLISLESYPWSDKEVEKSYFISFETTRTIIGETLGAKISDELHALKNSYEITISSADDLLLVVENFIEFIKSDKFNFQRHNLVEKKYSFNLMKQLYVLTVTMKSLVDHARKANKIFGIEQYEEYIISTFDKNNHMFLEDLRNFVIHKRHITPEWLMFGKFGDLQVDIKLNTNDLLTLYKKKWRSGSKELISTSGDYISLSDVVLMYRKNLIEFYNWYFGEIETKYKKELHEFIYYHNLIDSISKRCAWNLAFQMIKTKREFYGFLNKKLEFYQIKEVLKHDGNIEHQLSVIKKRFTFLDNQLERKIVKLLSLVE